MRFELSNPVTSRTGGSRALTGAVLIFDLMGVSLG